MYIIDADLAEHRNWLQKVVMYKTAPAVDATDKRNSCIAAIISFNTTNEKSILQSV
jgi:hypothetical protein